MHRLFRPLVALSLLAAAAPAWAHGLLVTAEAEGDRIEGRVYYSDGAPGAGEYVELKNSAEAAEPLATATTDADGRFTFQTQSGQSYLIVAHGEEGHTTEIAVKDGERGRLVESDTPAAENTEEGGLPPAWLLIGGLLLLSLIPAVWLKTRRATPKTN